MNEEQLENLLRQAPQPAPPESLRRALENDIRLPNDTTPALAPATPALVPVPFWRRWLPAMAYGVILLGCFILLAVQTAQVQQLRREQEKLSGGVSGGNLDQLRRQNQELQSLAAAAQALDALRKDNAEAGQLRAEIERLRLATADLAALRAEQQRLQAELSTRQAEAAAAAGAVEDDPFAEAKRKAQRIVCVNQLKQICLAVRIWQQDNDQLLPPNLVCLSNELNTTKILFCPTQTNALQFVRTWAELNPSQIGYELVSPGLSNPPPDVVLVRCLFHNNVGLTDGSVQRLGPDHRVGELNGFKRIVRTTPQVVR